MSDIQNEVLAALAAIQEKVKADAEAKAKATRAKVIAFVKTHVPWVVGTVGGYASGHFGLVGAVLKHFI